MRREDIFLFSLIFLTGIFVGSYVYITAFKPVYEPDRGIGQGETAAADFSIIGQQYGGLHEKGYISPSFRLLGDGTYNYVPGGIGNNALAVREGRLPSSVMSDLKQEIARVRLAELASPVTRSDCANYSDGTDYEYKVTTDGTEYTLDTCKTAFDTNEPLAVTLRSVWQYLDDPSSASLGTDASGIIGELLDALVFKYFRD